MAKVKKIPLRTCIACREEKEKHELLRVVHTKDGEISVDTTGKKNGRGAYICKKAECINKAKKAQSLAHAFGCQVADEIYDNLLSEVEP